MKRSVYYDIVIPEQVLDMEDDLAEAIRLLEILSETGIECSLRCEVIYMEDKDHVG